MAWRYTITYNPAKSLFDFLDQRKVTGSVIRGVPPSSLVVLFLPAKLTAGELNTLQGLPIVLTVVEDELFIAEMQAAMTPEPLGLMARAAHYLKSALGMRT